MDRAVIAQSGSLEILVKDCQSGAVIVAAWPVFRPKTRSAYLAATGPLCKTARVECDNGITSLNEMTTAADTLCGRLALHRLRCAVTDHVIEFDRDFSAPRCSKRTPPHCSAPRTKAA
jgi:hypothetical protein